MGAGPSIITVPSTSISKDIECLKGLCPGRFQVEKQDDPTTTVLKDQNGPLTIILVAIPVTAIHRIVSNRITFVLQDPEFKSVLNRCQHLRLIAKPTKPQSKQSMNSNDNNVAEMNLPGGAGFALVSPTMVKSASARRELAKRLAETMTKSLPKGMTPRRSLVRSASTTTIAKTPAPRKKLERQKSLGGGSSSHGRSTPVSFTQRQQRLPPMGRSSPRATASTSTGGCTKTLTSSPRTHQNLIAKNNNNTKEQMINPSFPTLQFSSLHLHGKYNYNLKANSHLPIPIETELFIGQMLLLLRPESSATEEDPHWDDRVFANEKCRFVLQVQGKFKYEPKGTLYAGLEASSDLRQMGRLSKGLSGLILKSAKANNNHLYYTFGDDKEKARAVVPAHTFFDRIIVTPQGQAPPSILEPLKEGKESIHDRKSKKQIIGCDNAKEADWSWNINDTYSMSFSSSNIDLPTWTVLNVPQLHDNVGLRALIGNAMLRFVMYENLSPEEKSNRHMQQYLRYAYMIQCKFGSSKLSADGEEGTDNEACVNDEKNTIIDWIKSEPQFAPEEEKGKVENDFNKLEKALKLKKTESDKVPSKEKETFDFDPKNLLQDDNSAGANSNLPDTRPRLSRFAFDMLTVVDALCPAWIDMWASQDQYTRAYAFNVNDRTVFRTPQSFRDLVSVGNYLSEPITDAAMDDLCSPRISKAEKTRRLFGTMLATAFSGENAGMLERMMELYSCQFLRRRATRTPEKNSTASKETSGLVARALSDRHWVEEWAVILNSSISFAHPETRKVHFLIRMDCIVNVRCLEKEETPFFQNYHFLAIETLGRTTYIMFASKTERQRSYSAIMEGMKSGGRNRRNKPLYLNNPREEFLQKSSMWQCDQRLLLNTRQMVFSTLPPPEQSDASEVVEGALQKALRPDIHYNDNALISFLDSASQLKTVNVNYLRDERRLAFFLNLYHVMVVHSNLIVGVNDSQNSLIKNFSCLTYQCSDDIFSISELEHCIIRAKMARLAPSVPTTDPHAPPPINSRLLKATSPFREEPPVSFKFPTPTSQFCFALQKKDFRINFALNCSSTSNPAGVMIYIAEELDEQLDDTCRQYLRNSSASVNQRNKQSICVLPRFCQWYADDFGSSNYAILRTLHPYLPLSERKILGSRDFTDFPISIKFLPFSFACRNLVLQQEPKYFRADSFDSTTSLTMPSMTLSDAPVQGTGEDDIDSLLDFLMDDALEI